jgi:hypothetical protein
MKGISIKARLNISVNGIFAAATVINSARKYAIKACQRTIDVETTTNINSSAETIFACEGSEWITE